MRRFIKSVGRPIKMAHVSTTISMRKVPNGEPEPYIRGITYDAGRNADKRIAKRDGLRARKERARVQRFTVLDGLKNLAGW